MLKCRSDSQASHPIHFDLVIFMWAQESAFYTSSWSADVNGLWSTFCEIFALTVGGPWFGAFQFSTVTLKKKISFGLRY